MGKALSRLRDELLEALAIAMLDQQEIESAELELNQLRRQADVGNEFMEKRECVSIQFGVCRGMMLVLRCSLY